MRTNEKGGLKYWEIEEKRKNYEETINLCKEALKQGWSGDWETRVEQYIKKINKAYFLGLL